MKRQVAVAGGVAVLILAVFFLAVLKPTSAKISETKTKTEEAQREAMNLKLQLADLQAAKRDAPATLAKLARYELLLPSEPGLPTFIRQIQDAANISGMDLTSIAPSPPSALTGTAGVTGVSVITVTLQVKGGFFRLESFLARLEGLQRVVEVQQLSVTPLMDPVTNLLSLQSSITLRMYVQSTVVTATPQATGSPSPTPSPTR